VLQTQEAKRRREQQLIDKIVKSNLQLNRWAIKRDKRNQAQGKLDNLRLINSISKKWLILIVMRKIVRATFEPFN